MWLKDKVIYPDEAAYAASLASYWSQQETLVSPTCIVRPESSEDVSSAVWLLGLMSRYGSYLGGGRCLFAIRGGGHAPFAGAANIDQGVTIDLSRMKTVSVNSDHSLTSVGPGARWLDVYLKLDAMNLAVPGGRVADVGVAGLTTGG